MGHALSEEHQQLLQMVDQVAQEQFAPRAGSDDALETFPRDAFAQLGELGLTGLPFAEADGGGGQEYGVYLRVLEEIGRGHGVIGLTLSVHPLATWAVAQRASASLRERVLPALLTGRHLGAYCLSEPGSGSDAAALVTGAAPDGDAWVLNGTKAWVTHAGVADGYVVFARTGEHKTAGISAFWVPAEAEGLSFSAPERKMGMRGSPTGQVILDDVRLPADHLLGGEGTGFQLAMSALDGGRLGIAALAVGLAQCALDHAVAYAGEREQFGQPIGRFQGVGFMLADMATAVAASRALYRDAAARRDAGEPYGQLASMAKLSATDTAMQVCTDAVQVFGGYGYTAEYPVERLMREAKVMQIFEGTNQIQRVVISRGLLHD